MQVRIFIIFGKRHSSEIWRRRRGIAPKSNNITWYQNVVNYCIVRFWSSYSDDESLVDKEFTRSVQERQDITARRAQCAAKQAREIVRSQKEKSKRKRRMPINLLMGWFALDLREDAPHNLLPLYNPSLKQAEISPCTLLHGTLACTETSD